MDRKKIEYMLKDYSVRDLILKNVEKEKIKQNQKQKQEKEQPQKQEQEQDKFHILFENNKIVITYPDNYIPNIKIDKNKLIIENTTSII